MALYCAINSGHNLELLNIRASNIAGVSVITTRYIGENDEHYSIN
jgi:hypothetical protein